MNIIVGLGNPGSKYKATRHNVGFETIDKLCYDYKINMKNQQRFRALIGEGKIAGKPILLVQPMTYMNLSGEAVRKILHFYKLSPSEMTVIYDDVALPVGDIRVREQGSAAGQKGMINIIAQLKTDEFPRIRIGVGDRPPFMKLSDYVLSRFLREEWDDMIKGITKAGDAAELILKEGTVAAMNKYNKKMPTPSEQKKQNSKLKLVRPNSSLKVKYEEMMKEWLAFGGRLNPATLLSNGAPYETWLQWTKDYTQEATCPPGTVPQTLYFALSNDGKLIGAVTVRHKLNDTTINENCGGHIEFGVRPTERKKGYAKEILRMALVKLKEYGITNAIINCDFDNIEHEKTILACGAILQNEVVNNDGVKVKQFVIGS